MKRFAACLLVLCVTVCIAHAQRDNVEVARLGRGTPRDIVWHPDGSKIFVVTEINELWIYDAATLEPIDTIRHIGGIDLSPNGRWLRVWADGIDGMLRSVDAPGQHIQTAWSGFEFSPDGRWMLARDRSGAMHVLDAETLDVVSRIGVMEPPWVHWRPDGQQVAWFNEERAFIWDIPSRQERIIDFGEITPFQYWAWSPDGTKLMNYAGDPDIRIWDAATGVVVHELLLDAPRVTAWGEPVLVDVIWGAGSDTYLTCLNVNTSVTCKMFDAETDAYITEIGGGDNQWPNAQWGHSPNGRLIALQAGIFDAETGELVLTYKDGFRSGNYRFWSSDSRKIAVSNFFDGEILIYDVERQQIIGEWQADTRHTDLRRVAWSRDGTKIAMWNRLSEIAIWDSQTLREVGRSQAHALFGDVMAFRDDLALLAVSDALGNVHAVALELQETHRTLHGDGIALYSMTWQPGGVLLATTSEDTMSVFGVVPNSLQIWDFDRRENFAFLSNQPSGVHAWSPDGTRLAMSTATSVAVWDVQSGKIIHNLINSQYLADVQWSADSSVFAFDSQGAMLLFDGRTVDRLGDYFPIMSELRVGWLSDSSAILYADTLCDSSFERCQIGIKPLYQAGQPPQGSVNIDDIPAIYVFGEFRNHSGMALSPDGTFLSLVAEEHGEIWSVGRSEAEMVTTFPGASNIAWQQDGRYFTVTFAEGRAGVYDAATREEILTFEGVSALFWQNDGLRVCHDGDFPKWCTGEVWHVATQQSVAVENDDTAVWSADGRYIARQTGGVVTVVRTLPE